MRSWGLHKTKMLFLTKCVCRSSVDFLGPIGERYAGSNFGLHAITAKHLKPEARVICIELSPLMTARMHANARLNNVNVKIISIALSRFPGFQARPFGRG
jgi:hypothetical protein